MNRLSALTSHLVGRTDDTSPLSLRPCAGELGSKIVLFQGDSITDAGRSRDTTVEQPNTGLGTG